MRDMFEKYVTNKSKIFNASYVKNESGGRSGAIAMGCYVESPVTKITYDHDAVKMKYYRRLTCYLGDTDDFIDRYIECDGTVLVDKKFCEK